MFFSKQNNKKVIKGVLEYYEGRKVGINFTSNDIQNAIKHCIKYRSDYSDQTIEKLKMASKLVQK